VLDVAIIGAGLMGRWHLSTARSLGARIVAIVDRDMRAAETLSRHAPAARLGTDLGILRGLPVKVAHVCTPTAAHAETAIALADLGIHAFVEKPLAASASVTGQVLEAALRNAVHVCPVHQYAFQPGIDRALRAISTLGPLHRIDFNICSAGADSGSITPRELVDEILPHPISILQRILPGAPVSHLQWTTLRPRPGELLATAMHDGVLISMFVSAHARPTCMNTQLQCKSGAVEINGFHGYAVVSSGEVSRGAKISAPFLGSLRTLTAASSNLAGRMLRREPAYAGLRNLTRLFYTAAASGGGSTSPIDRATILEGAALRDVLTAASEDRDHRRAS
jgi:predicted dehydrogenase